MACRLLVISTLFRTGIVAEGVKELVKGIAYAPSPCGRTYCSLYQDDFMSEAAKPLWGPRGRHDLKIISQLGASHVRLYGNSPENNHKSFLNEANWLGMGVIVGISDFPFIQMPNNCMRSGYDCYAQVKESYLGNLRNGFLTEAGSYHPALSHVIVINEADLKMPGMVSPELFIRAIISAIDGMLDAEAEEHVTGQLINFTATFSFGICSACHSYNNHTSLGQMAELQRGFQFPKAYGYTPRNDLWAFFRTRFIHSFNTANPAKHVKSMFLKHYESDPIFARTPVVIEEYHQPGSHLVQDLVDILAIADASPLLQGISFFEYQVRFDKGGLELHFGMFGFGDYQITRVNFFGTGYDVRCLKPRRELGEYNKETMPEAVTAAFGGTGLDYSMLCLPDPANVLLRDSGYRKIVVQRSATRMATFVSRIAEALGGIVTDMAAVEGFAAHFTSDASLNAFGYMVGVVARKPAWADWSFDATCVADRRSDTASLAASIGWACGYQPLLECETIPAECNRSVWDLADFVFGAYYILAGRTDPLGNCHFDGDAIFAAAPTYQGRMDPPTRQQCVLTGAIPTRPTTTATSTGITLTTTARPVSGECSFAHPPLLSYFWDKECVEMGGGAGCNADGRHIGCRWCGAVPFPDCPTSPSASVQVAGPALRGTPGR